MQLSSKNTPGLEYSDSSPWLFRQSLSHQSINKDIKSHLDTNKLSVATSFHDMAQSRGTPKPRRVDSVDPALLTFSQTIGNQSQPSLPELNELQVPQRIVFKPTQVNISDKLTLDTDKQPNKRYDSTNRKHQERVERLQQMKIGRNAHITQFKQQKNHLDLLREAQKKLQQIQSTSNIRLKYQDPQRQNIETSPRSRSVLFNNSKIKMQQNQKHLQTTLDVRSNSQLLEGHPLRRFDRLVFHNEGIVAKPRPYATTEKDADESRNLSLVKSHVFESRQSALTPEMKAETDGTDSTQPRTNPTLRVPFNHEVSNNKLILENESVGRRSIVVASKPLNKTPHKKNLALSRSTVVQKADVNPRTSLVRLPLIDSYNKNSGESPLHQKWRRQGIIQSRSVSPTLGQVASYKELARQLVKLADQPESRSQTDLQLSLSQGPDQPVIINHSQHKFLNQCGHKHNNGRLGHYGCLNVKMQERANKVQKILENSLAQIDTTFDEQFKKVLWVSSHQQVNMEQRNLLAIKHTLRLQQAGEAIVDFEEPVKPNEDFKKNFDFQTMLQIDNQFDTEKIMCDGCNKGDVYWKRWPQKRILQEKQELNKFRQEVKEILNNPDAEFNHPRKPTKKPKQQEVQKIQTDTRQLPKTKVQRLVDKDLESLQAITKAALADKDKKIARLLQNLENKFLRALTKGDHTQIPDYAPPLDTVIAQTKLDFAEVENLMEEETKTELEYIYKLKQRSLADEYWQKADVNFLRQVAADTILDQKYNVDEFHKTLLIPEVLDDEYRLQLAEQAKDNPYDPSHSAGNAMRIKYMRKMKRDIEHLLNTIKTERTELLKGFVNYIEHYLNQQDLKHSDPDHLDPDYFKHLLNKRAQAHFLIDDVRQAQRPINNIDEATLTASKVFARECINHNNAVPLSSLIIHNRIKPKLLSLVDIHLTPDQSAAFAACMPKFVKDHQFEELCLVNNKMTDSQLSQIMQAVTEQYTFITRLKSLTYSFNQIGPQSQQKLIELMQKGKIEHLALVQNRLKKGASIVPIIKVASSLLSLQSFIVPCLHLANDAMRGLLGFIAKASQLKTLDLSWNSFSPQQISQLFKTLQDNETIQYLNLAMTAIPEKCNIRPLTNFIKSNQNLLHLNLSGMFSTPLQVRKIMIAMKISRTLLSIHLSNTPAIHGNKRLQAYLRQKLNTNKLKLHQPQKENARLEAINKFIEAHGKFFDIDNLNRQIKENDNQIKYLQSQQYQLRSKVDEHIIFQRVLGYHQNSCMEAFNAKWTVHHECYLCERWQLTLFISKSPHLTTTLDSFSSLVFPNQPPKLAHGVEFMDKVLGINITQEQHVQSVMNSRFTPEELRNPLTKQVIEMQIIKEYHKYKKEELMFFLEDFCIKNDYNAGYSTKPVTVMIDKTNNRLALRSDLSLAKIKEIAQHKFFLWMDFIKPAITRPELIHVDGETIPYVPPLRSGGGDFRVVVFQPPVQEEKEPNKKFSKDASVFKPWIEDTFITINQCIGNDIQYWKVPKICKDRNDYAQVINVLRDNYQKLKTIYIELISGELFPNIGWFEFEKFCNKARIIDKYCTVAMIDRAFIAVNYEEEDIDDNPNRELCRYEFMEILVRIADAKYRQTKQASTFADAFERLLNELFQNYELAEWNEFRTQLLWAFEANYVFELNQSILLGLFTKLTLIKGVNGRIAWKNLISMLTDSPVQMKQLDAQFCFAMSKMTVIDDVDKRELRYRSLKYVEFLEYIARAAHLRFPGNNDKLFSKIEWLLDLFLPHYGLKRIKEMSMINDDKSDNDSLDYDKVDLNDIFMENEDTMDSYQINYRDILETQSKAT